MSTSVFAAAMTAARASAIKLTIFRIDENVLTLVAVTADAIEQFPGVAEEEITDPAIVAAALDAVERSGPVPEDRPIDARYALIFVNARDERILRVYKGTFASMGQIDDALCAFDEPVLDGWLRARYAS